MKEGVITEKNLKRRTVLAFAFFLLCFAAGALLWQLLRRQPEAEGIPKTLRQGLLANERVFGGLFDPAKLVRTYPRSASVLAVRVNGNYGLKAPLDSAGWRLQLIRRTGDTLFLTLDDIKKLPKAEIVFDFKCIEGWSQRTWWGGVTVFELMKHYGLTAETQMSYAGLRTPDNGYYVGIDMPSFLHPQTLFCYEMNGRPLPLNQGYPLRLIIPVKYGIKHLKRIGSVHFSNMRPPDYWAERGYDYYSGH